MQPTNGALLTASNMFYQILRVLRPIVSAFFDMNFMVGVAGTSAYY